MVNNPKEQHTDKPKDDKDTVRSTNDAAHQEVYSDNSSKVLNNFKTESPSNYPIHSVELFDSELPMPPLAPVMEKFVNFSPELEKILEPYLKTADSADSIPRGLDNQLHAKDKAHDKKKDKAEHHVINKGASEEHLDKVEDAYKSIRPNVRKFLEKHHIKIVAVGMMHDEMGEAAKERPRDYPPGYTWDHTDGGSLDDWTKVAVAEHYRSGAAIADAKRVEGVTRHETGHCLDHALGYFSHSDDFNTAFEKDLKNLPADVRKKLEYFIQGSSNAGKEETFAEIFALLNGGGSHPKLDPYLAKYFKNTINAVWAKIYTLE